MNLKKTWPILKGTFTEFGEDNVLRLSAALAYYAMFSIGPLLVIAVGLAGLAFGHEAVRHQMQQQLQSMLGQNSAKMIDSMMSAQKQGTSLITTIIGFVALLAGAGGVFGPALLFTIGKYLLALYLGRQSTASAYGAAGSVIVVLMWIYYASVILFLGAEFAQVYAKQTGTVVVPSKYAVPVTKQERAEQ